MDRKDYRKTLIMLAAAAVGALGAGAAAWLFRDKLAQGLDALLTLVSPRHRAVKADRENFADM